MKPPKASTFSPRVISAAVATDIAQLHSPARFSTKNGRPVPDEHLLALAVSCRRSESQPEGTLVQLRGPFEGLEVQQGPLAGGLRYAWPFSPNRPTVNTMCTCAQQCFTARAQGRRRTAMEDSVWHWTDHQSPPYAGAHIFLVCRIYLM